MIKKSIIERSIDYFKMPKFWLIEFRKKGGNKKEKNSKTKKSVKEKESVEKSSAKNKKNECKEERVNK